uniref:CCT domain-containing protein n=1 Tax=Leersia perrieri TaxID=77586 RepID=A0A0D9W9G2_9ORYZ
MAAAASTSGDPAGAGAADGEPASSQPRQPTPRISHIVRTYLDLSSNPKKRRPALPKSHAAAAAGDGKDGGESSASAAQSTRLLRELGVRVSRYTHEERRDIILRYMQKRSGRQGGAGKRAATTKVPSRKALAERRRRGAKGQFLGKEGVKKSTGKKKSEVYRHKNALVANKRQKTRIDSRHPDEAATGPRDGELDMTPDNMQSEPRNSPNQFLPDQLMQGHYILGHSYGLGTSENHHNNLNQFGQASSVPTLQQQAFPGNNHLTQGYPSDMHALQFVGANPQMEHQNDDQDQSSIPVWDFL